MAQPWCKVCDRGGETGEGPPVTTVPRAPPAPLGIRVVPGEAIGRNNSTNGTALQEEEDGGETGEDSGGEGFELESEGGEEGNALPSAWVMGEDGQMRIVCPECPNAQPILLTSFFTQHLRRQHEGGIEYNEGQMRKIGGERCTVCLKMCKKGTIKRHMASTHKGGTAGGDSGELGETGECEGDGDGEGGGGDGDGGGDRGELPDVGGVLGEKGITKEDMAALPMPSLKPHMARAFCVGACRLAARVMAATTTQQRDREFRSLLLMPKVCLTQGGATRGSVDTKRLLRTNYPDNMKEKAVTQLFERARRKRTRTQAEGEVESLTAEQLRAFHATLARTESLSKALKSLIGLGIAPGTPETVQLMREKHPARKRSVPRLARNSPGLRRSMAARDLIMIIRKMDAAIAPGLSGWTVAMLRAATDCYNFDLSAESEEVGNTFVRMLLRSINDTAMGRGWENKWLLSSRLIPLQQAGGKSPRPIACGEIMANCIAKAILTLAPISSLLLPNQWGVASAGGVEPVIHRIRLKVRTAPFLLGRAWDMSNAYNSLYRTAIVKALKKHYKYLLPYFYWRYGQTVYACMRDSTGRLVELPVEDGIQQGDPLGPFWLSIVMVDLLKTLQEEFPSVDTDSYLDDVFPTLTLPDAADATRAEGERLLVEMEHRADTIFAECGLMFNWHNPQKHQCFDSITLRTTPAVVLGTFIGAGRDGDAVAAKMLEEKVVRELPDLENVFKLPKQLALLTLRLCCIPRITHWLRTMPQAQTSAAAAQLDAWVMRAVARVAEVDVIPEESEYLVRMPLREGGLGLYPQQAIAPFAFAASVADTRGILMKRLAPDGPQVALTTSEEIDVLCVHAENEAVQLASCLGTTCDEVWQDGEKGGQALQHKATVAWGRAMWEQTFPEIETVGEQYLQVDLGSKLGRAWMTHIPTAGNKDERTVMDRDVVLQLRVRLRLHEVHEYARGKMNEQGQCTCGQQSLSQKWTPVHAIVCTSATDGAHRSHRHTSIKQAMARVLRHERCTVGVEVPLDSEEHRGRNDGKLSTDVLAYEGLGSEPWHFDVTVRGPSAEITTGAKARISAADITRAKELALEVRRGPPPASDWYTPYTDIENEENVVRMDAGDEGYMHNPGRAMAVRRLVSPMLRRAAMQKKLTYGWINEDEGVDGKFLPLPFGAGGTMGIPTRNLMRGIIRYPNEATYPGFRNNPHRKAGMNRKAYRILSAKFIRTFSAHFNDGVATPYVNPERNYIVE